MIRAMENTLTTVFLFVISELCKLVWKAGFSNETIGQRWMVSATVRNAVLAGLFAVTRRQV